MNTKTLYKLILSAIVAVATTHAVAADWETVIWKKDDKQIDIDRASIRQAGGAGQGVWKVTVTEREKNLALEQAMKVPAMKDDKQLNEKVPYITMFLVEFDCDNSTERVLVGQWFNIHNGLVMKLDTPQKTHDTRANPDYLSIQQDVCKS